MNKDKLPELLSPAGSFAAFKAAIDGGADAIYVGGTSFNARINADNFNDSELAEAIRLAHIHNVKVYRTLNIELFDREIKEFLDTAYRSAQDGIDAFIVSDIGGAELLHKTLPEIPLHASTQMSIHSTDGAKMLEGMGFCRVVPAREMSSEDICSIVRGTNLEIEMFVHGALCVCHSGQCLFSSVVGGRSGNRGLCAQPCRLPYFSDSRPKNKNQSQYPLSLKDLSLATHVKEIIASRVASLKIEGRMKSPEYVYGVTRIWRELLDTEKDASPTEMRQLSEIFSRGGFTDGYFTGNIGKGMLGVRSSEDKKNTRQQDSFEGREKRREKLDMALTVKTGEPSKLLLNCRGVSLEVEGAEPFEANNNPIGEQSLKRNLSKLGDTEFFAGDISCTISGSPMLPMSAVNELRRRGAKELEKALSEPAPVLHFDALPDSAKGKRIEKKSARFLHPSQITDKAREYFDETYLPLWMYDGSADGFVMPAVIFDSEKDLADKLIRKAIEKGAKIAIVGNLGAFRMLSEYDIDVIGDYRFNITNTQSVCALEKLGFDELILSPELKLPQIRDIQGNVSVITYGRLPLMTLEKCVISEVSDCKECEKNRAVLKDRRGFAFPVIREWGHRNILYNSQITYMADREKELECAGIKNRHYIFTIESPSDVNMVLKMHKDKAAPNFGTRRL